MSEELRDGKPLKGIEYLATQQKKSYCAEPERSGQVAYTSYIDGFRKAREMSASLIESFNSPKFAGVPLLIRAIGQAEVDPDTGKPVALEVT